MPTPDMGQEEAVELDQQDREQADAACKKLEQLLANDDGDATDFINEMRDVLRGILGANRFQEIKKAADAYDFQKARDLLAYSGPSRSAFRADGDHDSGAMPIMIPG